MNKNKQEAIRLRSLGMSVKEIAKTMRVSKSSVSVWVREIVLTDKQKAELINHRKHHIGQIKGANTNRTTQRKQREQYQELGRQRAREKSWLHSCGCMLYWAEGAKGRNTLNFVNSDAVMMRFFMQFLREELHVTDAELVIHITGHTDDPQEIERMENYWLETLQVPRSVLRKTVTKKGSVIRHNTLYNGVCSLRIYNTKLVHHIYGAIQEYTGIDHPEWLD